MPPTPIIKAISISAGSEVVQDVFHLIEILKEEPVWALTNPSTYHVGTWTLRVWMPGTCFVDLEAYDRLGAARSCFVRRFLFLHKRSSSLSSPQQWQAVKQMDLKL